MKFDISHERINFALLSLIIVCYPFHLKVSNAAIFVFAFHWIIWAIRKPASFYWKDKLMWLLLVPYLLCIVGLLYTSNIKDGIHILDKKVALFILPFTLGTIPRLSSSDVKRLMLIATGTVVIALFICLAFATYKYIHKIPGGFFWKNFTVPLDDFHPTYLALYINVLIAYLASLLIEKTGTHQARMRLAIMSCIVFFYVAQVLLSSKIQLLSSAMILLYFIFKFSKNLNMKFVLPTVIVVIIIAAVIIKSSFAWERFTNVNTYHYKLDAPVTTFNELTIRFGIIDCSLEIIKNNLLFGVGPGDVDNELGKMYIKYDFKFGYLDTLNPHNEFLSQLLGLGLLGCVIFVVSLIIPFLKAMYQGDVIYIIFIALIVLSFTFESMLERQKGIVLFSLFNSLFLFHGIRQREDGTKSSHD